MKVLFVGKRRPQQRDLMDRPYGRFHHLPMGLHDLGHEIRVALISHAGLPRTSSERFGFRQVGLDVRSESPMATWSRLRQEAQSFQPDWIIGMSDAWYGWLAHRLAKRIDVRFAVDAYDNFEAYMPWNLPLRLAWRRAVSAADLVTAAGPQLADRLQSRRARDRAPVAILPMAADPEFLAAPTASSRERVGLPQDIPLLGYVGSWTRTRGTRLILDVLRRVQRVRPDARLVLSGRHPAESGTWPGVTSLGYIADEKMPSLINALDVACVVTADTAFGRFSYPAKLCEAMACNRPVVATRTGAIEWMLGGRDEHLAPLGDADEFARKVLGMLDHPAAGYGVQVRWAGVSARLENLLESVLSSGAGGAPLA